MSNEFLIESLAIIAGLTSLTVQAIKKILDEKEIQYSSNLLAVIVSTVLTVGVSMAHVIYFSIPFSPQLVVIIVALTYLSFLCATVGYDKVSQLLNQIWGKA
jgi:hypothetical protein